MPANNPSNSSKHSEQRAAGARPVAALLTVVALALALLPAASSDGLAHAQGAPTVTPLPDLILDGRSSTESAFCTMCRPGAPMRSTISCPAILAVTVE